MGVGADINRVDAYGKVTGQAKYVADLEPQGMLVAKVVHSTIANGLVKSFRLEEALAVEGVEKIVTCFDVPQIPFGTAGHPWSTQVSHQDTADRLLLNQRVRLYGDDIAAVIARDSIAADRARRLIQVEYEEYSPILTTEEALRAEGEPIHAERPDNILGQSSFKVGEGEYDTCALEEGLFHLDKTYRTQIVQHCHIEPPISYAYRDINGKIVVTSSTQIPHIVRRIVGQALGIPWGSVRVIKPYIGGGFGNKQDILYEPLNAYLCTLVGGRPVHLELTREETFACTRVRHAVAFHVQALVRKDGTLVARKLDACSNQGAYASHGHGIVANGANHFKQLYQDEKVLETNCRTVYTNTATAGAMRGYGIPQSDFAVESMTDDLARMIGMDPYEYRMKNCVEEGYEDPHTHVKFISFGLKKCMQRGKEYIHWEEKRREYADQTGSIRRGVGMAIFCYKTGVYPISLETSACRMVLNQDGSIQVQMGATEIGQGADTVFTQMAAETLGITEDRIFIQSMQDTDITPFDPGAYASRQSYVSGKALKKTAIELRRRILAYAAEFLKVDATQITISNNSVVAIKDNEELITMSALATEALYSLDHAVHLTAEETSQCKENTFASGVCFAEVEVDIPLGKVKVLNLINVHDSGTILNPALARAQVHGGMSMGLGYALSEQLLYNQAGKPLNDNLLDYKLPTAMDTPHLEVDFVEVKDATGPYGNKALGEPPAIPVAPAIRNAVLHATGVAVDTLPLDPQKLIEHFKEAGLIA
ncbi:MAG: xanthine dehydrogenase molybdenum-binding subunit XdhA [Lachnospiraceae bacterium]